MQKAQFHQGHRDDGKIFYFCKAPGLARCDRRPAFIAPACDLVRGSAGCFVRVGRASGQGRLSSRPRGRSDALGVPHKGRECCNTSLRNLGGKAFGVSTDTGTPRSFSASILNAASVNKLVDSAGSTSKSRSLSSVSVPLKTDPKTRGRARPCCPTSSRNSLRCAARAADGFILPF
jgi:hypothetical protein